MKLEFVGAAQEVTGSKHLIKVNGKKILLDCGMFQGRREESAKKNREFGFDPKDIDAVILSHAHIDHSGLLPLLVKQGFQGPIFCTHATRDLCHYMLLDSAYIQERDAEYMNKKKAKKGEPLVEPLYNTEDAQAALNQFYGIGYERTFVVEDGVAACFYDAGHILGSAVVHLIVYEKDKDKRTNIGFTGDLGRKNIPLLRDPQVLPKCDYYLTECTYGDRLHESVTDADEQLIKIVNDTYKKGGKLIIPAFSVGRTQEVVYRLNVAVKNGDIPEFPIFVDSPLSGNITEVFSAHPECFDKETYKEFIDNRLNPFGFGRLKYISDVEESKKLNHYHGPCIIISASGMCEFGRILHHLKNNVEDHKSTVLIVGYQASHTLGRKLQEGQKVVNIFGDSYNVRADVYTIDAFSAHADRSDLLDYVSRVKGIKKIFLVHGEKDQGFKFKDVLLESGYKDVEMPAPGDTFDLT
ncbi:MBL fold metallo-hydrolase [Candidatus Peregrinibacteria bacterium]|nr:MBL fold metallo-hydrolase [Candidatus Peregrinibacteria bacterium]